MRQRETSWTKKLIGIAGAFGLTFAMACASTADTDEMSNVNESDQVAVGQTTDPVGPPQHIATRPLTNEHPSSNTGYGNADSSGANTNLNNPKPKAEAVVHQSDAVVTQTPIVEEETVIVETEPVVEETVVVETEPVEVETTVKTAEVTTMEETETRRVTKKE